MFRQTCCLCISLFLIPILTFAQESDDSGGCAAADCHADVTSVTVIHAPLEDGCETCHEASDGEHPGGAGSEFSLVDAVPDLCYMCHDAKNEKATVHAPVDDGDCTTCHSPHGSNQPRMLIVDDGESVCESCHDFEWQEKSMVHGPVQAKMCTSCHNPHQSDNAALLQKTPPTLCFTCHEDIKTQAELPVVHAAFAEDCLNCHHQHGSDLPSLLLDSDPDLCLGCHDHIEEAVTARNVHKPFREKRKCLQCHNPHAGQHDFMLSGDVPQLCFDCHRDSPKTIQPMLKNRQVVHPPAEDGDCTSCHSAHGSDNKAMLLMRFPDGAYASDGVKSFQLCFECHDTELVTAKTTVHATNFRDGKRNLHFVHVNRAKGRSCNLCHEMHASDKHALIAESVNFGNWQLPLNYEKSDTGGSCLPGCHQQVHYKRE